jgi:hypothetical protein
MMEAQGLGFQSRARRAGGAGMQEAERVQAEIQKIIGDDPTIQDANKIIVMVEKKSFWKGGGEVVILKGKVHEETDKAKAHHVAELHAAGREIQDSIVVVH